MNIANYGIVGDLFESIPALRPARRRTENFIEEGIAVSREGESDLIALDEALVKLTSIDPRKNQGR